jgi:hypothetical protein
MLTLCLGGCEANSECILTECQKSCGTSGVSDNEELEVLILKKRALHDEDSDKTLLETPYSRVAQTVHPSNAEGIEGVI